MTILIVYDSQYGNTEKIARAIYGALGSVGEGECLQVGADQLVEKGGKLIIPPEGFYVNGTEGPYERRRARARSRMGKKIAGSKIIA